MIPDLNTTHTEFHIFLESLIERCAGSLIITQPKGDLVNPSGTSKQFVSCNVALCWLGATLRAHSGEVGVCSIMVVQAGLKIEL